MTTIETIQTAVTVEEVKVALLESGKVRDMANGDCTMNCVKGKSTGG